jgi:molybdopterin-guanine dinucleotide biosynthesis protein A
MASPTTHAVIVAGGAGRRLAASAPAGTPSKLLLTGPDGGRLIDGVLAATAWCRTRVVVAGPVDLPPGVHRVREDPPLSGPAAAIATGVRALETDGPDDMVLLVAGDLVSPADAVETLRAAWARPRRQTSDGCVAVTDGRRQPLLSMVRLSRLRTVVGDGTFRDAPVRALLRTLDLTEVPVATAPDIDTWEDAVTHGYGSQLG